MSEIIKFVDPVLLIGGGELSLELLEQFKHLPIVAADGGANHLQSQLAGTALTLTPELILGDLDSLNDKAYWQGVTQVVEIMEQDSTDFEKCLYSVSAPYFVAAGFSGRRLDHTLASLHVMQKYCGQKRIILTSNHDALLVTDESVTLQLPLQTRVSVYPLSTVTFDSSEGLSYPLDGLTLQSGVQIGTSNCSDANRVVINPLVTNSGSSSGIFAVIVPIENSVAMIDWFESNG